MQRSTATSGGDASLSRGVTRRAFGQASASLATGALAFVVLPSLSCGGRSDDEALARRMLEIFEDQPGAASLGRVVLATAEQPTTAVALVSSLTQGWTTEARSLPTSELHAALREQQRADFSAGRTLRVRGWVLARTEASLAALAALSGSA